MSSPPASPPSVQPRRSPVRQGLRDAFPLFIPAAPFGLVLGVTIAEGRASNLIGWTTSWIIFGGAAQLTVISLFNSGAIAVSIALSALVVNARHLMYSMAVAPRFADQPRWFRWLGSYVLIDQLFAMIDPLPEDTDPAWMRRYWLTAGFFFWGTWQITTALGILLGSGLPETWRLDFAVPILFGSIVVVGLKEWPMAAAALAAFIGAAVFSPLPNRSGLLVGALIGVIVGTVLDARKNKPTAAETNGAGQ